MGDDAVDPAADIVEAARFGDLDDVREYLSADGSLANAQPALPTGGVGPTPLHYAAANGHTEIMKLLLTHGADPNAVNEYKNTPLHFAAVNGREDAVRILLEHKANTAAMNEFDRTPFDEAVTKSNQNIRGMLMKHIEENAGNKSEQDPFRE